MFYVKPYSFLTNFISSDNLQIQIYSIKSSQKQARVTKVDLGGQFHVFLLYPIHWQSFFW